MRELVKPFQLDQQPRWNMDAKAFRLKVYTPVQSQRLLTAMRAKYKESADVLPTSVDDLDWTTDKALPHVDIVPAKQIVGDNEERDVTVLDGNIYPLKETIKAMGFTYVRDLNGMAGHDYWLSPLQQDYEAVAAVFLEWGWTVTVHDASE